MTSASASTRRHELDHLRILATLGVITLHAGVIVVLAWQDSRPDLLSKFNAGNLANSGGRFAVNCFFMTSGALLLDPVRRFALRPQFLRVALPTLTWIAIYVVANLILNRSGLRGVHAQLRDPASMSFEELVRALLAGPAFYHLWFVYVLLAIYLVVPLLRAITERPEPSRGRLVAWLTILWLAVLAATSWAPFLLGDRSPTVYAQPLQSLPTGYLGLFVLGFALSHYRERLPKSPLLWVALAAAGLAWAFTATWLAASAGDPDVFAAYGNLKPAVLMYSVGVFAFFLTRSPGAGPTGRWVRRLSALTFRVYLVHALVLHALKVATPLGELVVDRPVFGLPAIVVATVVVSFAIAWLLDQIGPLRRFV